MKLVRFLLLVGVVAAFFPPLLAHADNPPWVPVPSPYLPPEIGQYVSPADWHVQYANGIYIDDVRHHSFTQHYPPPGPGGSTTESFSSKLDLLVTVPGYGQMPAHITDVLVTVRVDYGSQAGNITTYNTEMLQLAGTWASPFGEVLIRESPTLHSLGQTKIDDLGGGGGGGYMIQSFFDVFTELEVGGDPWSPSTNPNGDQVNFTPEPATLALLAMGSLLLIRRRS